jgi:hypothetical protein
MSDPLSALPSVAETALPASVRAGTVEDRKAYKAALGFERLLLDQVAQTMTKGSALESSPYAGAVHDAFTGALADGGGIGLAAQLYASMRPQESRGGRASKTTEDPA